MTCCAGSNSACSGCLKLMPAIIGASHQQMVACTGHPKSAECACGRCHAPWYMSPVGGAVRCSVDTTCVALLDMSCCSNATGCFMRDMGASLASMYISMYNNSSRWSEHSQHRQSRCAAACAQRCKHSLCCPACNIAGEISSCHAIKCPEDAVLHHSTFRIMISTFS